MRIILFSLISILIITGCNSKQREDDSSLDSFEKFEKVKENSMLYEPASAIWQYNFNQQTEKFEIVQSRPFNSDTLTGKTLEKIINQTWPKVQIKFIKTSNDTAYIVIPNSEILTQQMGTTGADSFMISTTFSFTELNGIKYVNFDFEEGDHTIPGTYNRNSWNGIKNQ